MTRPAASLQARLLLGSLIWIAAALVAAGVVLTGLFREHVQTQFEAHLAGHLDQLLAVLGQAPDGAVQVTHSLSDPRFRRPYSGLYWQIEETGGTSRLRSRSLWDACLALPGDAPGDGELHRHRLDGPEGQRLTAVERLVRLGGSDRPVRAVVAGDVREVELATGHFGRVLGLALVVLAAGLAAAALLQVRGGLAPLGRLRRALADIRRGRLRHLEGRFPREVQPLVDDLNALLEHNAAVVERARSRTGDLAHSLKTPLSILLNAAEAASSRDDTAALVRLQAGLMRRRIDYHLARARAAGASQVLGAVCSVEARLHALCTAMELLHADPPKSLAMEVEADLMAAVEAQDFDEMLGNLLDNACKWADRRVLVAARSEAGQAVLEIDDDGPGLPPEEWPAVFERGYRLDEAVPGSGLGLAIVRDLATSYAGSIGLERSPLGGLRCVLRLPGAGDAQNPGDK